MPVITAVIREEVGQNPDEHLAAVERIMATLEGLAIGSRSGGVSWGSSSGTHFRGFSYRVDNPTHLIPIVERLIRQHMPANEFRVGISSR